MPSWMPTSARRSPATRPRAASGSSTRSVARRAANPTIAGPAPTPKSTNPAGTTRPSQVPTEGTQVDLDALIPDGHREFVDRTLLRLGVPPLSTGEQIHAGVLGWLHSVARSHVDVALSHRIALIANALGSPPPDVI